MVLLRSVIFASWNIMHISALGGLPQLCAWDPPLAVAAGTALSARITNAWGRRCQAKLGFADSDFFPITFNFQPHNCTGVELAQFTIPTSSPSGDAYVLWQCAGRASESCVHLNISQGLGTLDVSEGVGTSGCVVDSHQTTTTLITRTTSNSVISQTIQTIVAVPVTILFPESAPGFLPTPSSIQTPGTSTHGSTMSGSSMSTPLAINRTGGSTSSALAGPIVLPVTTTSSLPSSIAQVSHGTISSSTTASVNGTSAADARALPSTASNTDTDPGPTNTTRDTGSVTATSKPALNDAGTGDASGASTASTASVALAAAVTTLTIVTTLAAASCSD